MKQLIIVFSILALSALIYFGLFSKSSPPKAVPSRNPGPYESDGDGELYYSARAGNPRVYWAYADTDSCASVEYDPAMWRAGVSKKRGPFNKLPEMMQIPHLSRVSGFDIECESREKAFERGSGKQVFSPSNAIQQLESDEPGARMPGPFVAGAFSTKAGNAGVRVARTFTVDDHTMAPYYRNVESIAYMFPINPVLEDSTWRARVVTVKARFPASLAGSYLSLVDQMVGTLKISQQFPDDEPHNRETGYLSAELKQMYGDWNVSMCNSEFPTEMRWTVSPVDNHQALVTIGALQRWEDGIEHNYRLGMSFKSKMVHVGNGNKVEVLLNDGPPIHLVPWSKLGWYRMQYIYGDSATTLNGQLDPTDFSWDDPFRGSLVFVRSDGKPLDARRSCRIEQ